MESAPSSEEFQKEYIRHYLEASFEDKVPLDTLKTELSSIYSREILVSTSMYEWANNELKQHSAKQVSHIQSAVVEVNPKKPPSLYGPDTLYHASLCCCAVTQRRDVGVPGLLTVYM